MAASRVAGRATSRQGTKLRAVVGEVSEIANLLPTANVLAPTEPVAIARMTTSHHLRTAAFDGRLTPRPHALRVREV
jgi:hypothetical protein